MKIDSNVVNYVFDYATVNRWFTTSDIFFLIFGIEQLATPRSIPRRLKEFQEEIISAVEPPEGSRYSFQHLVDAHF